MVRIADGVNDHMKDDSIAQSGPRLADESRQPEARKGDDEPAGRLARAKHGTA